MCLFMVKYISLHIYQEEEQKEEMNKQANIQHTSNNSNN